MKESYNGCGCILVGDHSPSVGAAVGLIPSYQTTNPLEYNDLHALPHDSTFKKTITFFSLLCL